MHASQRHKTEVHELNGLQPAYAALTITYPAGTYPAGLGITAYVNGDSTGDVSAFTRLANAVDQDAVATAVAAAINALTGFTASAVGAVVTIAAGAPNASVSVLNTLETLD